MNDIIDTDLAFVNNICRTCLIETEELKSLFKIGKLCGELTKLSIMLNDLSSIMATEEDELPQQICHKCVVQISKAYFFKQTCLKSDLYLRDKINKIKLINESNANDDEPEEYDIYIAEEEIIEEEVLKDEIKEEVTEEVLPDTEIYTVNNEYTLESQEEDDIEIIEENIETECSIEVSATEINSEIPSVNKKLKATYKCKVCSKILSNSSSYRYHMQLHSDKTPFLCNECGAGFKTKNAYDGHMITHNPNNPNTCTICNKSYRSATSLRMHTMSTHEGEKPFLCGICGKRMTQKSGFKKHMLVHTGEKPHKCDVCGKEFRYTSNLNLHVRNHSGERPHSCKVCDKKFLSWEGLKRHTVIHTGEKPFKCEFCGRLFNRKTSLRVHAKLHTGEKKHICIICGKGYIQLQCLKSHMANHVENVQ